MVDLELCLKKCSTVVGPAERKREKSWVLVVPNSSVLGWASNQ